MDFAKLSKTELLLKCEEHGITKCKSKTKAVLISLLKNVGCLLDDESKSNKSNDDVVEEPKFSKKEFDKYEKYKDECVFKNPKEEYMWAEKQIKKCSKCLIDKKLSDFARNTSGRDPLDQYGYRSRRPECNKCTKIVNQGKRLAKKRAIELGISYNAPTDATCSICNKPSSSKNKLVFDHCHVNNIFRGYCCNSCNRSMGVLGDNIESLLKVINYLLKTEKCDIIQNETGELIKCIK